MKPIILDQHGNKINTDIMEIHEQHLARQFIEETDVVLELGARYGSVSCIINSKLNVKTNQVVVEPDERVWNALGFVNIPFGATTVYDNIEIIENTYVSNPYGTQCYMIRRRHAKKLVDFFSVDDIYSVYQDRFIADYTIFATDDKLKCNRTSLKFPIVIEDLSEQSIIGNNNKPNLLNILDKDMFLFGPDILMTT